MMQGNDDEDKDNKEGPKDGRERNEKAPTNDVTDEGESEGGTATDISATAAPAKVKPLIVPTKTEDGGSRRNEQLQAQADHQSHNQGQGHGETAASNMPDLFQIYSDTDTRMLTLLGIEPSNPNDAGEQQEDWRQLIGFLGMGEERRRNNNGGDGNGNGTTPRRSRVTTELHISAFENMWFERGELNLDEPLQLQGQARRQQEEENDGNNDEGNPDE